ncbi:hypothetical protein A1O3_03511 [Capronia epimyces CBS 606.96]|uniref:Protein-lysine N-methyltransferase EFM4 n=1 Tax=Capronia epimyces CBS 606.96 TaxID=1182542 RepID=W9Y239_9EURO|nr:uncharacterized protein A1O3_03511 [Capronia epimyces CBS 606.96]EXJ86558.1 hypothetical protein A1O3_03511 [Capronia epimyces CBS 606.96]
MSAAPSHPAHLDPSELGTKEYWDRYYQNDLDNGSPSSDEDDDDDENNNADADDDDEYHGTGAEPPDPSELESWFDDVGAPQKTLAFLTSTTFPLSPNYIGAGDDDHSDAEGSSTTTATATATDLPPTVLDLGTGNGSALFALRLEGGYTGRMVGVDYSTQSVELARKLWRQYGSSWRASAPAPTNSTSSSSAASTTSASAAPSTTTPTPTSAEPHPDSEPESDITFQVLDLIHDTPAQQAWWPTSAGGFDLVLDKGTFDAISLSSATVTVTVTGTGTVVEPDASPNASQFTPSRDRREWRVCELYPAKVLAMVKPGGFLLVTSCNWTEEEVVAWFTGAESEPQSTGRFEVYDTIKYPVFEFGGQRGQGVASVCFRKVI